MSEIKAECKVPTYDGDLNWKEPQLTVQSAEPRSNAFVVLLVGGKRLFVKASALKKAIDNCTNV